jgi:ABC-type Mn2+/Zn2+ transport system ATPase subunit
MTLAIETNDPGKHYADVKAFAHLSLQVREGEIDAFLGLNGAGNAAPLRMLLGLSIRLPEMKDSNQRGQLFELPLLSSWYPTFGVQFICAALFDM